MLYNMERFFCVVEVCTLLLPLLRSTAVEIVLGQINESFLQTSARRETTRLVKA